MPGPSSSTVITHAPAARSSRHPDRHRGPGERHGVLEQIGQELREPVRVGRHRRVGWRGDTTRCPPGRRTGTCSTICRPALAAAGQEPLRGRRDHLGGVRRAQGDRHLPRLELGQVEQVANEALQPARLRDDHVGRLPVVLDRPVLYRLGEAADGGERRAQVVRHRQQEVTLPGPAVLQALGHVVDGAGQRRELGVVVAAYGDAARQLAGCDAARHLHRLHQRAGHAAAHLPRHQRGDEEGRAAGDDEVAPTGPEPADVAGQEDGEGATEAQARGRRWRSDSVRA